MMSSSRADSIACDRRGYVTDSDGEVDARLTGVVVEMMVEVGRVDRWCK
jgi:hypothetical protein